MTKHILCILYIMCSLVGYAQTRNLELPAKLKGVPERIINHEGYTLSFNKDTKCPNWVAWELTAEETQGTVARSQEFFADPDIPPYLRIEPTEYRGSGYDRGHMCPAADMKWSVKAMRECFYMTNMCPQNHNLNGGAWEKLESACRRWAQQEGRIYIVCGPIYHKDRKKVTIGKEQQIRVPDAFFKVVLSVKPGQEKAIGFIYRNDESRQPMGEVCCSVDDVEELTGYDFFVNLDKDTEKRVEASYKLSTWK